MRFAHVRRPTATCEARGERPSPYTPARPSVARMREAHVRWPKGQPHGLPACKPACFCPRSLQGHMRNHPPLSSSKQDSSHLSDLNRPKTQEGPRRPSFCLVSTMLRTRAVHRLQRKLIDIFQPFFSASACSPGSPCAWPSPRASCRNKRSPSPSTCRGPPRSRFLFFAPNISFLPPDWHLGRKSL